MAFATSLVNQGLANISLPQAARELATPSHHPHLVSLLTGTTGKKDKKDKKSKKDKKNKKHKKRAREPEDAPEAAPVVPKAKNGPKKKAKKASVWSSPSFLSRAQGSSARGPLSTRINEGEGQPLHP